MRSARLAFSVGVRRPFSIVNMSGCRYRSFTLKRDHYYIRHSIKWRKPHNISKWHQKPYLFWTVFTCKQCLNCAYIFRRDVSLKVKNVLMDNKTSAFCFARHSLINGVVMWIIVMFLSAVGTFFLTALDQICFQQIFIFGTAILQQ